MSANTEQLIHWLIDSLELKASVFHVGQYCGNWKASTAGRARASFHLILRGTSYLHLENHDPIALAAGEGVFLLRDLPHFLSPTATPGPECQPKSMLPMNPEFGDGTGLACGFFDFHGSCGELLESAFPDYLLIRKDHSEQAAAQAAIAPLFELMLHEAERDEAETSPLLSRLTELLFFYIVREAAQHADLSTGLWAVGRKPQFAPLLERLLSEPGHDWSLDEMAGLAHMSRASFCKHFGATAGHAPAQFLLQLRMHIAANRLRSGESVTRAAEHVGYQSPAAFTRAFARVIGEQPGAYQRSRRH